MFYEPLFEARKSISETYSSFNFMLFEKTVDMEYSRSIPYKEKPTAINHFFVLRQGILCLHLTGKIPFRTGFTPCLLFRYTSQPKPPPAEDVLEHLRPE